MSWLPSSPDSLSEYVTQDCGLPLLCDVGASGSEVSDTARGPPSLPQPASSLYRAGLASLFCRRMAGCHWLQAWRTSPPSSVLVPWLTLRYRASPVALFSLCPSFLNGLTFLWLPSQPQPAPEEEEEVDEEETLELGHVDTYAEYRPSKCMCSGVDPTAHSRPVHGLFEKA